MKKITLFLALSFVFFTATSALASKTFTSTSSNGATGVLADYRASNNVTVLALSAPGAYAAYSGHLNGDRQFGSSSGDSQLYWQAKTSGTAITTAPTTSDSSQFATGWTAL